MQEEYVSLLTVFENLEALYICRNVITIYPDCKSMIDVAKQKLMNDPTFKHLSEDCQEYYFDFEAYADTDRLCGIFRKGKGKVQRIRFQAWHGAGTAVQTDGTFGKAGTA